MTTKPGDTIRHDFIISSPQTGYVTNADASPSAILVRSGSNTAVPVSVENKDTGQYRFGVTIPATYNAGDYVSVVISASVGGSVGRGVVWDTMLSASRISDSFGSGTEPTTITVKDQDGDPLDNVAVWITTDAAGNSLVTGTLHTNSEGNVNFVLDAGPYYVWRQLGGHTFSPNPVAITVS